MTKCGSCGATTTDTSLCWGCTKKLRHLLTGRDNEPGLDWLTRRLIESAYGQAKLRRGQRSSNGPAPMPLNTRASDLLRDITGSVLSWMAEAFPAVPPVNPVAGVQFLAENVHVLMMAENAPKMLAETEHYRRAVLAIINRPPDVYCGPCPAQLDDGSVCGFDLRANEDERFVECRRCHHLHDVENIRANLLDHIDDEPKPGADLLRILRWMGHDVKKSTFYSRLGRVAPRMYLHPDGQRNLKRENGSVPLYSYSDVVAVMVNPVADDDSSTHRRRRRPRRDQAVQ